MRTLLLLSLALAAALAVFLVRGREALAQRDQAHVDLLRREQDLDRMLADVGTPDEAEYEALRARHDQLVATAQARLAQLAEAQPPVARPRLAELLDASSSEALQPGGALHAALRAAAGLPEQGPSPDAEPGAREQALAAVVETLEPWVSALDIGTLQLQGDGTPRPLPDVPALLHVGGQLVLSGALPDVLRALEALAPAPSAGLPAVSVTDVSLRRIEPARWGPNLHRLDTPPVRLTATLDILLSAGGGS